MGRKKKVEVVEAELVLTDNEEQVQECTSVVEAVNKDEFALEVQMARLTPEEVKQVATLKKSIDFNSTVGLMSYGNVLSKKREVFSDAVLQKYKNKDVGSVGDTLTGVVMELKSYKLTGKEGFFTKLFRKSQNKIEEMRLKYENVDANVNKITGKLEGEMITLVNDVNLLDKMYVKNIESFKEHTVFIIAAKQKLDEVRMNELVDLRLKAEETGLPEDAEEYKELESKCNTFEKYIYNMCLSRTLCLLSLPRLKAIQNANEVLVDKIKTTISTTIPIWKDTIANAIIAANTEKALATQNAVDDATNAMLRNMSDHAKNVSIGAAKASQRGIVDVDTLKYMYDNIVTTVNEIKQIEEDGAAARASNERELLGMEKEYSVALVTTK